jgi:hypothetical protein
MLKITVPAQELWDEEKQEFLYSRAYELQLEHSLVSLSKWEAKYGRAFLSKKEMTFEETLYYIKCMTITQNVNEEAYEHLTTANISQINKYIESPMTATYFSEQKDGKKNGETVTAELIYYWMIALNIPLDCQKWHLNRLLTLIRVCNIKNQPPKKRSRKELLARNAALNEARRKQLGTRG